MTATKAAAAPSTYVSGFCGSRRHDRCLGSYVGTSCTCPCHSEPEPEPEPEVPERPPGPYLRLSWAASAIDAEQQPLNPGARRALAAIFRSEAAWAAARHDTYPADRAPLLQLADLINGGVS